MKAILHFFNEPVAQVGPGPSDFNVLHVLKHAATPEDFVAIKVIRGQLVYRVASSWQLVTCELALPA